jgi:hypothetical protein
VTARALLVGAVVLAAAPMLTPGLPVGADTVTHLYTLVHVEDLLRHGVLFSRWLPWQNGGLGNPRFLFYPCLPYYAVEPLVLLGVSHPVALRVAFVGALALAGLGCFAWCRRRVDERGAAVGAAVYVLAPYVLFATYARASFAEVFALAVAPWALWAAECWREAPSSPRLAASAALAALTILCHPITGGLLLLPWVVLHLAGGASSSRRAAAATLALALAIGASAVLWLPARAERGEISDVHTQATGLDYRHNFVPPGEVVAWRAPLRLVPGLSLGGLLLAVVALARSRRPGGERWVLAAGVGLAALLVLPRARLAWIMVHDLAKDVQFPHRLLGIASLLLAGLAADGAAALAASAAPAQRGARVAAAIALAIVLGSAALPLRHLGRLARVPPLDVSFIAAKDRLGLRGFGYSGEFMPRRTGALSRAWHAAPSPQERLSAASLPPGATLVAARYEPLRYEAVVDSPAAWRAVWKTLAFAGWTGDVDGRPAPTSSTLEGLLTLDVPGGRHRVTVEFGTTPARRRGWLISSAAILMLAAMAIAGRLAGRKDFAKI